MITAEALRQKIEAHRADQGSTEILELALWAFEGMEALQSMLSTPWNVEPASVPKAGVAAAPAYQVVGTMHVSLTKLEKAREALAKFPKGET